MILSSTLNCSILRASTVDLKRQALHIFTLTNCLLHCVPRYALMQGPPLLLYQITTHCPIVLLGPWASTPPAKSSIRTHFGLIYSPLSYRFWSLFPFTSS